MSNYHVLNTHKKLKNANTIFHIQIPDENNSANPAHNLRTCVHEYQGGGTIESSVPNLDTEFSSEYSDLQTGALYEWNETVIFSNANLTNSQKRDEIDARYTELSTTVVDYFRKILKYWGMNRDVP